VINLRKRLSHQEEVDSDGSWAVSYGDMITLLLSFFVIYFSTDFKGSEEVKLQQEIVSDFQKPTEVEHVSLETMEIVKVGNDKMAMFFKGESFFTKGDVELNNAKIPLLQNVAQKLTPYLGKYKIKVQAFTDNTPVRSTNPRFKDNVELSALRAIDVMRKLNQFGIPMHRMEISGRGILSEEMLKKISPDVMDNKIKKDLSRTIGLLLFREEY
jgi:chemotaxis protein MotB